MSSPEVWLSIWLTVGALMFGCWLAIGIITFVADIIIQ